MTCERRQLGASATVATTTDVRYLPRWLTKSGEGFRTKFIDERDWEDPETLATALAEDFSLEDPSEPEPITKATIAARMGRWVDRMKAIGGKGQVENSDEALDDRFKVRQAMAAV